MKEIDKCKRKLKIWNWMNKYLGTVILSVYVPLISVYLFLARINPVVALIALGMSFVTVTIGGYTKILFADDENVKILLEKQIATIEDITEEKLEVLAKSIQNFKENNVVVQDKQTTKSLVKELIIIHKSAEKALKEKQLNEGVDSFNIEF